MRKPEAGIADRGICVVSELDIHYLRHGSGPVVVVVHDSPGSATSLEDLIVDLGEVCTVVVPDLPGHGGSGPFDRGRGRLGLDEVSAVLGQFVDLVVGGPFALVGLGVTGGTLARRLACTAGERVSVVVLDHSHSGTRPGAASWPEDLDLTPQWNGTHLVALFHAVRDRYLYNSPRSRSAASRIRQTLPGPWALHNDVMDVLEAGEPFDHLRRLARESPDPAALPIASDRLIGLRRDAAAAGSDTRDSPLPQPPGSGAFAWAAVDPGDRLADVLRGRLSGTGTVRTSAAAPLSNDRMARRIVVARSGDSGRSVHLLVRSIGQGPPVVLFHPSPGSASHLEPLMRAWSSQRTLITIDNPGQGYSDHPERAELGLYTELMSSALDQLDLVGVDVWGTHTGAKLALDLAVRFPHYVKRLILDGIGMYSAEQIEEFRTQYIRPMVADLHGTHLLEMWHERRDMYLFFPWYKQTRESARTTHPRDVRELHDEALEFFRSGPSFHHAYWAALSYPAAENLARLGIQTLLSIAPTDPLKRFVADAQRAQPNLVAFDLPERNNPEGMKRCVEIFEEFFTTGKVSA